MSEIFSKKIIPKLGIVKIENSFVLLFLFFFFANRDEQKRKRKFGFRNRSLGKLLEIRFSIRLSEERSDTKESVFGRKTKTNTHTRASLRPIYVRPFVNSNCSFANE